MDLNSFLIFLCTQCTLNRRKIGQNGRKQERLRPKKRNRGKSKRIKTNGSALTGLEQALNPYRTPDGAVPLPGCLEWPPDLGPLLTKHLHALPAALCRLMQLMCPHLPTMRTFQFMFQCVTARKKTPGDITFA